MPEALVVLTIVPVLLAAAVGVAWRRGHLADPAARRGVLAGTIVLLFALGVNELSEAWWPIETALVVGAVLVVTLLFRAAERRGVFDR